MIGGLVWVGTWRGWVGMATLLLQLFYLQILLSQSIFKGSELLTWIRNSGWWRDHWLRRVGLGVGRGVSIEGGHRRWDDLSNNVLLDCGKLFLFCISVYSAFAGNQLCNVRVVQKALQAKNV